jgi:hypothetical protein
MSFTIFILIILPLVIAVILRPRTALAIAAMTTASLAYYGLLVALLILRLFNETDIQ